MQACLWHIKVHAFKEGRGWPNQASDCPQTRHDKLDRVEYLNPNLGNKYECKEKLYGSYNDEIIYKIKSVLPPQSSLQTF